MFRRTLRACVSRADGTVARWKHGRTVIRGPSPRQPYAFDARAVRFAATGTDARPSVVPGNLVFDKRSSYAPPIQLLTDRLAADEGTDYSLDETGSVDGSISTETEAEDKDPVGGFTDNDDDDDLDWDAYGAVADVDRVTAVVPLPDRLKVDIRHIFDGSVTGTIHLDPSVFGVDDIRTDLIKQNVDYIRRKMRGRRKAKTKTIAEVSGSGRKVRPQKGTGRARAGHSRPPHWRGGAKAHGPKNTRNYGDIKMNRKMKRLAIRSMLSQKLKEGNLILVDHMRLYTHKTKEWARILQDSFGFSGESTSLLVLDHYYDSEESKASKNPSSTPTDPDVNDVSYNGVPINLQVASGNLHWIKVGNQRIANVFDMLRYEKLMLSLPALQQIENRWKD